MANDSTSTSFVPAEASEGAPELTPRIVEASTIRDAMRAVLDQLGPDARIIATARLHRSGHDGLASQRFVRVTALPAREPRAPDHIEPKVDDVERSLVEVQGADDLRLVAQTAAEFSAVLRVELERRGLRLPTVGERDEVIAAGGDDRLREVRLGTLGVDTGESVDLRGGTSDASEPTLLACEPDPTKPGEARGGTGHRSDSAPSPARR